MTGYLAKSFPLHNRKSRLMRHRAFSFHLANRQHPAARKQKWRSTTAAAAAGVVAGAARLMLHCHLRTVPVHIGSLSVSYNFGE